MNEESRIRLLNKLLAAGSPVPRDLCADAALGVSRALELEADKVSTAVFAKNILRLYDPEAEVEVLEFGGENFDPLFAIPSINAAVKRLAGYTRAILVVAGLYDFRDRKTGRAAGKRMREYSDNVDFVEGTIMRYKDAFPNLEIFFI